MIYKYNLTTTELQMIFDGLRSLPEEYHSGALINTLTGVEPHATRNEIMDKVLKIIFEIKEK